MRRDQPAVLAFVIRFFTGRASLSSPRLSSHGERATPPFSRKAGAATTAKTQREIDIRNPFIPASSPVCRVADTALLFGVALAGLAAAGTSIVINWGLL